MIPYQCKRYVYVSPYQLQSRYGTDQNSSTLSVLLELYTRRVFDEPECSNTKSGTVTLSVYWSSGAVRVNEVARYSYEHPTVYANRSTEQLDVQQYSGCFYFARCYSTATCMVTGSYEMVRYMPIALRYKWVVIGTVVAKISYSDTVRIRWVLLDMYEVVLYRCCIQWFSGY